MVIVEILKITELNLLLSNIHGKHISKNIHAKVNRRLWILVDKGKLEKHRKNQPI